MENGVTLVLSGQRILRSQEFQRNDNSVVRRCCGVAQPMQVKIQSCSKMFKHIEHIDMTNYLSLKRFFPFWNTGMGITSSVAQRESVKQIFMIKKSP
jgi:hypothetical protein